MPILRAASAALATALQGNQRLFGADLFTVSILGASIYHWTSWDQTLTVAGQQFAPSAAWLTRGRWGVKNTMEVPTLDLFIIDNETTPFTGVGTPTLRTQIHNGLLDGASVFLQRAFMPNIGDTTTLGTVDLFLGDVGEITLQGAKTVVKVRGKNSRLNIPAPLNVYQPGCIHTFCDAGCTLSAATFTLATTVTAATRTVVHVSAVPAPASQLKGGTLSITGGLAAGQKRSIADVTALTLTLSDPLTVAPLVGDTVTVFTGCDKTLPTCDVTYSNKANFGGFPFIPPPPVAAVGQNG